MELTEKDIKMPQSPFRYPGSKNKLLPVLMKHIDYTMVGHDNFTDVFVGGGSVLLAVAEKYPQIQLYANDKDYWVYCFWKIISDVDSIAFLDLLRLIDQKPTLELFYKLREEQTTDEVRCAYKAIFFNRTTFSGIFYSGPIGGKEQKSIYTIDCRYNSKKLRDKLQKCRELLRGRTYVSNKNFLDYEPLTKSNDPMYLDPPYVVAGKSLYVHYMTEQEHVALGKILNSRLNWILSYDDSDIIKRIYYNCDIYNVGANYSIIGEKTSWSQKSELIIIPK